MGFLSKGKKETGSNLGTTVISQGTSFVGELVLDAKLHIDGSFEGTVTSTSDVSIGASGRFEGSITARGLLVSGHAKGNFECDRLEIIETGHVYGEVISEEFVIEPGGRFVGGSRSRSDEPVAALRHMKDAPKPAEVLADPGKDKGGKGAAADAPQGGKKAALAES